MIFYRKIEKELNSWKAQKDSKVLMLRGARQVGKSTLVRKFGKSFKHYIELNLEKEKDRRFFTDYGDNISSIINAILLENNVAKDLTNTLLFIDEIQESPKAIKLLRYFYEDLPELHVIAAGSLLEFAMSKVTSFPVGRVLQMAIHPMDFEEFLMAIGEDQALEYLNKIPLPSFAYNKLLALFHIYTSIGGMPEVIQSYVINKREIIGLNDVYSGIWDNYLDDVEKYASNTNQRNIIRHILHAAPSVRDRITYANFGGSSYRSRDISGGMSLLDLSRILRVLSPTTSTKIPLVNELRRKPKIQFLDTGIMNFAAGIQDQLIGIKDLHSLYRGYIVNHIVNQEVIAQTKNVRFKPHFWVRENANSNAEVDLITPYKQYAIPVEIKSGPQGRLRSLHEFMDRTDHTLGIRLLANNIMVEDAKTRTDKAFTLLNLPYFLACKLPEYIKWIAGERELGIN